MPPSADPQQTNFVPQTVAEFFFADETGQLPHFLDMQEVDLLYNDYIRVMSCMHERLRAVYNQYVTRFFDEKIRKTNNIEADTQRLILPGEEGTDGECDFSKMFEDVGIKNKKPAEQEPEQVISNTSIVSWQA